VAAPGPAAHRRIAADAVRARAAPRAHVRNGARVQAVGRGGRSDQQPHDGQGRPLAQAHADAADRLPQATGHHRAVHESDQRHGGRRRRFAGGRVLPDGHVDPAVQHGGQRRAHAHAAGAEVARHATLAPGARVRDGQRRRRPGRRLPVGRPRAYRHGARLAGGTGAGRQRVAPAGPRSPHQGAGQPSQGDRRADRGAERAGRRARRRGGVRDRTREADGRGRDVPPPGPRVLAVRPTVRKGAK